MQLQKKNKKTPRSAATEQGALPEGEASEGSQGRQLDLLPALPSLYKLWLFVETSPQAHFTVNRKNSV